MASTQIKEQGEWAPRAGWNELGDVLTQCLETSSWDSLSAALSAQIGSIDPLLDSLGSLGLAGLAKSTNDRRPNSHRHVGTLGLALLDELGPLVKNLIKTNEVMVFSK